MTTTPWNADQQVSVIRKELVALTQNSQVAVVLNQLLYWTRRVKDFDLFLKEERARSLEEAPSLNHGWIYKTADELIEETLLTVSRPTMRKYLKILVEDGWMEEKRNLERKWDQTSHFRLNLKRIHDALLSLGYSLSGFERDLFHSDLINEGKEEGESEVALKNLMPTLENLPEEEKNLTSMLNNLTPKLENFPSKERILTPKLRNLNAYTYTENTHKNTNKDHTQETRVCEKKFSDSKKSEANKSIAQEMLDLWESHIVQTLFPKKWQGTIRLTKARENQLESLFAFYFRNDIRLWERFCLRIKAVPFLMGENPSGWHVTLDWVLCEENLNKILEGNFDASCRIEDENSQACSSHKLTSLQNDQKDAILASIKDPVWKKWCSQLAEGVRLNDLQMLHPPLSLAELNQIADARFLECEEERLIWISSQDQGVLNKIEKLRLKINWVLEKEYPKARTFRTRLDTSPPLHQPSNTGENSHA